MLTGGWRTHQRGAGVREMERRRARQEGERAWGQGRETGERAWGQGRETGGDLG